MSLIQEALEKANRIKEMALGDGASLPLRNPFHPQKTSGGFLLRNQLMHLAYRALSSKFFLALILMTSLCGIFAIQAWITNRFQTTSATTHVPNTPGIRNETAKSIPSFFTSKKFVLSGITIAEGNKLALINNQVVGVGDNLREGAKVLEIDTASAVLQFRKKQIKLSL